MPPRSRLPAWIALPFALSCAACATPPPTLVVPPTLLACRPQPVPPEAPDDPAVARWILDTVEAGADCRSRLSAVREIVSP